MKSKSQKAFVGVTLTTVIGIAMVLVVYAALLGTMSNPGNVFIGSSSSIAGSVKYSTNNAAPWSEALNLTSPSDNWYARVELSAGYYYGPVLFTWRLQRYMTTWTDVSGGSNTTSITLDATTSTVYVSGASSTGNENWKTDVGTQAGTYRVYVTVDSA